MEITRKHYGIDGNVQNFVSVTSMERIGGRSGGNFNEDAEDEYYDAEGDYSNAGGLMSKIFGSGYEKRRNARLKAKSEENKIKARAKLETAKSKTAQAKASEKSVAGDIAMADALKSSAPTSTPEEPKGMSMGLKIGIGVGVVVVLGVVGFIIYKSMKGKKAGK